MVKYEELLKSKDAEIEMLRNICATLKTALNMELKFQRNNAKSFAEFKAPELKKEEPIKILIEVKPKTSDEIFAERLAKAIAFRESMDNAEKDLQMKFQMQTVKQTLELSRQFKQHDFNARFAAKAKAEAKQRKELAKAKERDEIAKSKARAKQLEELVNAKANVRKLEKIVKATQEELAKERQQNAEIKVLLASKNKPVKTIESKLAIDLKEEIANRELHKSFKNSSIPYFAKKFSMQ
jgi:hypothetical protein